MAGTDKKLGYRILLGAVVVALGGSMLLYLVPQAPGTGQEAADTLASVGGQNVTVADVRQRLNEVSRNNPIPKPLEGFYAQQILSEMVLERELEYEAKRLDIRVTNEELADRIRLILPSAFSGASPVATEQYAAQVQARFNMTYPVFEELLRQELLADKFRKLVTDGISVGPAELQQEFTYRNQKVKLAYVMIKPEDLQANREMERDLNSLLEERLDGREPSQDEVDDFLSKHGGFFPGARTLDDIVEQLSQREF